MPATAGGRRARRPRRASGFPFRVDDVDVAAERGKAQREHGLTGSVEHGREEAGADLGPAGAFRSARASRRRARTATGTARGSRLAGGAERLQRGQVRRRVACGMSARTSVGERPSMVTRSGSTSRQRRSPGQSGAPSAKTIVAAARAHADHRPRAHDPAHVGGEVDAVARPDVGLIGGLRAIETRKPPCTCSAPSACPVVPDV